MHCLLNGISRYQKYPPSVRRFALNLNFHSPRAYEFLRRTFDDHLPNERTLRKWYALSNLNSPPGITNASMDFLRVKVIEQKHENNQSRNFELVCALCLDEMYIRKQAIFDQSQGQIIGYVSYGQNDEEERCIAKEALVFVLSGLTEKFRIPVAYHFVNSLNASQKADLLKEVLLQLMKVGVRVVSITFDCHATNKPMCELLGANLDIYSSSFKPYIILRGDEKIFLFFDVCHTEKLVRAQFDRKSPLVDIENNKIKWDYIQSLVKFKEQGLTTHKLNQTHINWTRRAMNVRIAVETLSKTTADCIDLLRSQGYKDFIGSRATVDFIRLFNDLFDIFNTKYDRTNQNIFKRPIRNKDLIFNFFDKSIEYIKALKFRNDSGRLQYICKSQAKSGFVGYIINMHCSKMMYMDLIESSKLLEFIPTYYINQDAVEMFFGKIRSHGGYNDNPNVIQFQAAYRKLLANDSITVSRKGNCESYQTVSNPFTDILFISSRRDKTTDQSEEAVENAVLEEVEQLYEKLADLNACASSELTDDLQFFSIAHIASIVEDKIRSTDNCPKCVKVFDDCEKIAGSVLPRSQHNPCISTYKICREADQFLKLQVLRGEINFKTIYYSILSNLDIEHLYTKHDFIGHPEHRLYLIRTVVEGYIRIKGVFLARTATQELHGGGKMRYQFRKLIQFYGQ